MRTVHRIAAFFFLLFFFYMAVTGGAIQAIDLTALLTHAPASDPNIQAIRESEDGPANFAVIGTDDYDAAALPANFDFAASLRAALPGAHLAAGASSFKYVEWRMLGNKAVAQFKTPSARLVLNADNGKLLAAVPDRPRGRPAPLSPPSAHNAVKAYHRGNTVFGDWTLVAGMIVGTGLAVMIVTGLVVWVKLYAGRVRLGRYNPFWDAGSQWRQLHRAIALVSAVFILLIAFTGAWLEFDDFYRGFLVAQEAKAVGPADAVQHFFGDVSSPLTDTELPGMLATTLTSFQRDHPDTPIKVLRLRYFTGYAQGVVIAGGNETTQLVYNARSGQAMTQTEPGYPMVYFPFGWLNHETLKKFHRGDYFGLSGRVMSMLSSLALIYLSISGIVMYLELWGKRRRIGRKALFWK